MNTALIFNIQKFCVHDGPGIRTTIFFKGCPLHCLWCHNPESQAVARQMLWTREKCSGCGQCEKICYYGAVYIDKDIVTTDDEKCVLCNNCIDSCIRNAREIAGTEYTVHQLLNEIEKDRPFYDQSHGGVTLSGGEVMSQIDFVVELAQACKDRGISVAIDTCGYVPFSSFEKIIEHVDLFLYDIKIMDASLHQRYTGQDNAIILDNFKKLAQKKARLHVRIPLIEGINTDDHNIKAMLEFIKGINVELVNLLPYHDIGTEKYVKLGIHYEGKPLVKPSDARLNEIKTMFEEASFKVKIGG